MTKFYYDQNDESKHCLKAMYDLRKNKDEKDKCKDKHEKDHGKDKVVFYEKDYAKNKCKCSKSYYN
ncbi:hypothetical protein ACQKJG_28265 [Priestia megaterium]|uniref:Uncharacterized protein n=1 Tax=Priestia megaterium TaxID=1404 RepID=A0AAX6BT60_PRIMG|nr:hypothetical protein [Priestia megaterium]GMG76908.1 hypothetical protein ShirakiTB12_53770 [Priestia megaterium]